MNLAMLPPIDEQLGGDPDLLRAELVDIFRAKIRSHPRSAQQSLGPSEVGEPCSRRIAYKLLGTPHVRELESWRATVGTALHAWAEEAVAEFNMRGRDSYGASRFLLEQRIDAGPMAGGRLTGTTDLFDRVSRTVIDYKFIGPSSHKNMRADINAGRPVKRVYRTQLHVYGLGWTLKGQPVERVAIFAPPVAGELRDALFWSEAFDASVAHAAIARVNRIHALTSALGPAALLVLNHALVAQGAGAAADPDGGPAEPAIAPDSASCMFCPWLNEQSVDVRFSCPGDAGKAARSSAANGAGLIPASRKGM